MLSCTGIPVAWGIMDREDIPTLEAFFRCIKGRVPSADVNTLMTDDGEWHNDCEFAIMKQLLLTTDPALPVAFRSVFSNATHLLCRWHIDRYKQSHNYAQADNATLYTHSSYRAHLTNHIYVYSRAWQRKLYSMVSNSDNRKELYQALWLLITSPDPESFHQCLQHILCT